MKPKNPKMWHQLVMDEKRKLYCLFGPYTPNTIKAEDRLLDLVNAKVKDGLSHQVVEEEQTRLEYKSHVESKGFKEATRFEILPELYEN
jgi:hypothetical protein